MLSFTGSLKVFVALEPIDMRKGFEGLHAKKMPGMNGTRLSSGAVAFAVGDFLELAAG